MPKIMLVEHNRTDSQADEPEGGGGNGGGGVVEWVVTKVSKGSNHFLIHCLSPLLWSP